MNFTSVLDPDSFFTESDPGFFVQSGFRQPKTNFFKSNKILGKFWFSTQKVGILVLFSTHQVGILLYREWYGGIFKNK